MNYDFRAWDKVNNKMVYEIGLDYNQNVYFDGEWHPAKDYEIMLGINKRDSYFKEIYIGDYVLDEDGDLLLAEWDEVEFCLEFKCLTGIVKNDLFYIDSLVGIEVVGNIKESDIEQLKKKYERNSNEEN